MKFGINIMPLQPNAFVLPTYVVVVQTFEVITTLEPLM
jgi:hypothetical protein